MVGRVIEIRCAAVIDFQFELRLIEFHRHAKVIQYVRWANVPCYVKEIAVLGGYPRRPKKSIACKNGAVLNKRRKTIYIYYCYYCYHHDYYYYPVD